MSRKHARDVGGSWLAGMIRVFPPMLGYLLAYPVILSQAGAEVLGLWSFVAAVPALILFADFGFVPYFTRAIARSEPGGDVALLKREFRLVGRALALFCLALVALATVLLGMFEVVAETVYSRTGLTVSVLLTGLAATLGLQNRLLEAPLRAGADNIFVQFNQMLRQIIPIPFLVGGALLGFVLEAFGAGLLLAEIVQMVRLRRRLAARHGWWTGISLSRQSGSLRILYDAARRSSSFYAIFLVQGAVDPSLRYTIGIRFGLEYAAIYEVAWRILSTFGSAFASGLQALMPALSALSSAKDREFSFRLFWSMQALVMNLVTAAAALLVIGVQLLLPVWLPQVSEGTALFIDILLISILASLYFAIFRMVLIAEGMEKLVLSSVSLNLALAILIYIFTGDLTLMILLWTCARVAAELYMLVRGWPKVRGVVALHRPPQLIVSSALVLLLAATLVLKSSDLMGTAASFSALAALALASIAAAWKPFRAWRRLASEAAPGEAVADNAGGGAVTQSGR